MSAILFTPYAFSKVIYMRDKGETEVGGFCVSIQENPDVIVDFHLVEQVCNSAYCEFTDSGMIDFNDEMAEAGYHPQEYSRMWLHTHPGTSAHPSGLDEETFTNQFGGMDWSAMLIVARGGQTYGRIRYSVGNAVDYILGGKERSSTVDLAIDWTAEFSSTEHAQWDDEYDSMVTEKPTTKLKTAGTWAQREYTSYLNKSSSAPQVHSPVQKIIGYQTPYDSELASDAVTDISNCDRELSEWEEAIQKRRAAENFADGTQDAGPEPEEPKAGKKPSRRKGGKKGGVKGKSGNVRAGKKRS